MSGTPADRAPGSHPERLDGIDQLRAVAMLAVVTQHCGLLPMGWTGVWLFYVISGYVITAGIVRRGESRAPFLARYGEFMALRASRIVPALVVYLVLCGLLLSLRGQGADFLAHVGPVLGFVFNARMMLAPADATPVPTPLGHLWTISVEQQFYLLFPLLAMAAPARWRVPLCWAALAAAPLLRWATGAWLRAADPQGEYAFQIYASTFCHIDAFLAGALIAYGEAGARHDPDRTARRRGWARGLLWLGVAAALAYAAIYVSINASLGAQGWRRLMNVFSGILYGQYREVFVYVPVVLLASAAVLYASLRRQAAPTRAGRAMAWIGRVSYSGYLLHMLIIWTVLPAFGGVGPRQLPIALWLGFYATSVLLTLAASHLMYEWVERPGQRWLRQRLVRRSGRAVPSA